MSHNFSPLTTHIIYSSSDDASWCTMHLMCQCFSTFSLLVSKVVSMNIHFLGSVFCWYCILPDRISQAQVWRESTNIALWFAEIFHQWNLSNKEDFFPLRIISDFRLLTSQLSPTQTYLLSPDATLRSSSWVAVSTKSLYLPCDEKLSPGSYVWISFWYLLCLLNPNCRSRQ